MKEHRIYVPERIRDTQWVIANFTHAVSVLTPAKSLDEPNMRGQTLYNRLIDTRINVEDEAIANAEFNNLLEGLTKEQQTILTMKFRDDFTLADIARTLGLSIYTIRTNEQKGLLAIKEKLQAIE